MIAPQGHSSAPCPLSYSMDLPSTRELELEALLRQRDAQLAHLTVRPFLCFPSHQCTHNFRHVGRSHSSSPISLLAARSVDLRSCDPTTSPCVVAPPKYHVYFPQCGVRLRDCHRRAQSKSTIIAGRKRRAV